jgi:hypothetical protein
MRWKKDEKGNLVGEVECALCGHKERKALPEQEWRQLAVYGRCPACKKLGVGVKLERE